MLSANVLVIVAGAIMMVVIVMGRARGTSWPTIVARCALTVTVAWILALTLFPIPVDADLRRSQRHFSDITLVPFRTIRTQLAHGLERSEARQMIGNVAIFGPLGFLLPVVVRTCRRLWVVLTIAAATSVSIEGLQLVLPGHATDVDDVILNAIGAALGYLAFATIDRGRHRLMAPDS